MEPLLGKKIQNDPAKSAGQPATFEDLGLVLQRKVKEKAVEEDRSESSSCDGELGLEVVEENGVIKKIIVRCQCGRVNEIDCSYEG